MEELAVTGSTATFAITRKDGSVFAVLVDAEDLERVLAAGPWRLYARNRSTQYALRHVRVAGKKTSQRLHRFLMGDPPGLEIDHINMNGLDNRRANLRAATRSENQCNRGRDRNNTSGYKGVCWHNQRGKWAAKIWKDGQQHSLGLHATPEEAYKAYCAAAERLHGDFRRSA